ncbi:MAG: glycoside hydrolase family 13 protein [Ruminococcaceae bacterium]|nr:glycoside hydrolase family 13 protein [Oscillospiraceae bacterium]
MRILYNSKDTNFKMPFGTLTEGQKCKITIHIPVSCRTKRVRLVLLWENGEEYGSFVMPIADRAGDYEIYSCTFAMPQPSLYFYYFKITTENESFSLYRQGYDQTNMEAGELWQLSCVPSDFDVPRDFCGNVMYQIFPDRFYQQGECDTASKLTPFWMHEDKTDIPCYLPDERGKIQNCDFFGGNLKGIASKLDYLKELGVKIIYLNPIFKAWSNHRYDTADYHKIDELLGTEDDFRELCEKAHEKGMKIILDGVFSHTGSNSRYFDKLGVFGGGAYSCADSPFRSWYDFQSYPDVYTSWWGIDTLPCVNETAEGFMDFIINGENSVVAHWIKCGADGFRLDVADELPDEFITAFRKRLKQLKPDALLIGEVWEDASNKISYGKRRRYFTDGELDSVMNYPFRKAVIDLVCGRDKGEQFKQTVMNIAENYPKCVLNTLMNMLSTHDTERIISVLSDEVPQDKAERAGFAMSDSAREKAEEKLRAASFLQFVLPGMPCIYYGDEIGMEGFEDPFCRGFFNWEKAKDSKLRGFFTKLAQVRNTCDALKYGDVNAESDGAGRVVIERKNGDGRCVAFVNTGLPVKVAVSGEVIFSEKARIQGNEAFLDSYGFVLQQIH